MKSWQAYLLISKIDTDRVSLQKLSGRQKTSITIPSVPLSSKIDDPLILKIGERSTFIDLGVAKLIAAERNSEKIAVEIKSFINPSPINDLENAWGQFFLYARALQKRDPDRRLYLAVSRNTFETLFQEEAEKLLVEEPGFRIIVFDTNLEKIIQWQPQINL